MGGEGGPGAGQGCGFGEEGAHSGFVEDDQVPLEGRGGKTQDRAGVWVEEGMGGGAGGRMAKFGARC